MGENSKIEWTHHTFNPWLGCTKVSPACANCYAEAWAKRSGMVKWGDSAERRKTSESNWRQPLKWNAEAARAGEIRRVFCASLADVGEDRPELKPWRKELMRLVIGTPNLFWLFLTKRPQNMARLLSEACPRGSNYIVRKRVGIGTTVESQDYVRRIDYLVNCRAWASVLFLSCEPLLSEIDLYPWLHAVDDMRGHDYNMGIDWVIVGGESGPYFRPLNLDHARNLRDQCAEANVPFFFKQHGGRTPKAGGCQLDGQEWKEFPKAA